MTWLQSTQDLLEELPSDVIARLPPDVLRDLSNGVIDRIPENVIDTLPAGVVERIPDGLLTAASADPMLSAILLGVGVLSVLGFLFGVAKSAFKAALFAAVVGAGAWYWYFQI